MIDLDPTATKYQEMCNKDLVEHLNKIQAAAACMELPRYKCHKEVWALKIAEVRDTTEPGNESDGSRLLIFDEKPYAPIRVDMAYVHKHKPEAGGYYVVYADGYKSFSPAKAFEDGYTKV